MVDLTDLLQEWDYSEGKNIRFLSTVDGREIMQVRLPLGIEQYEMIGRPDGKRPKGYPSWLDYHLEQIRKAQMSDERYIIEEEEFSQLREEGLLFYSRYLILFQTGKYYPVAKDSSHNLEIARIVDDYFPSKEKVELLQYLPYIRRVNAVSLAMIAVNSGNSSLAVKELERGIREIEDYESYDSPIFNVEKTRSLQNLNQLIQQIGKNTVTEKDKLAQELERAIESENYEQAARIRDKMKDIDSST